MTFSRRRKGTPTIQMMPMIDVIFFLLTFFILFTTFKTQEAGIGLELPRSTTAQSHDATYIELQINEAGSVFYEGRLVSQSMLRETISPLLKQSPRTPIIIKADKRAKYEHVYAIMDLVSQAGGSSIHLAARLDPQ